MRIWDTPRLWAGRLGRGRLNTQSAKVKKIKVNFLALSASFPKIDLFFATLPIDILNTCDMPVFPGAPPPPAAVVALRAAAREYEGTALAEADMANDAAYQAEEALAGATEHQVPESIHDATLAARRYADAAAAAARDASSAVLAANVEAAQEAAIAARHYHVSASEVSTTVIEQIWRMGVAAAYGDDDNDDDDQIVLDDEDEDAGAQNPPGL